MRDCFILILFFLSLNSCNNEILPTDLDNITQTEKSSTSIIDHHTLSNYKDVFTSHLDLDLEISFDTKKIYGSAIHTIDNKANIDSIIFDTKNLEIIEVSINNNKANYYLGQRDDLLGVPLIVKIDKNTKQIKIEYSTTDKTEALDWLEPKQTAGKQAPFVYTQGESIFTRSWIPIQDTPGLRITYSAKIKTPDNMLAVMSASNPVKKDSSNIYEFSMPQAIPCYLIAFAVGDLEFVEIDERTGVYTEPSMLNACKYEFADMHKMVDAAEDLFGKYLWDRFDVIVLPPSFPFGGMENPRLTFATPTIIAGDRSLTALIAHELAHSWSGNLVTNATWNDFWLNEGFTVYLERRIMEELYGKDYADMLALLGKQDLQQTILKLDPKMQLLKLKLVNIHPDYAMSDIAYEKGYFLLRLIEETLGREKSDVFFSKYFKDHSFQTIVTEEFIVYLQKNLLEPNNISLNIDDWIYKSGLPDNCPTIESVLFNNVDQVLNNFYSTGDINSIKADSWSTHEFLHFIRGLKDSTTIEQMSIIDNKFSFTSSGNSEIACAWFEKSIYYGYKEIDENLEKFLIKIGRRKFLQPLYIALSSTPEGRDEAIAIYSKAKENYHYISSNTIDRILGLK